LNGRDSPQSYEQLIQRILRYCVDHPDAKDTLDGILKWWLKEARQSDVQHALDFLVSKQWLTARETAPGKKIYGLNKDRLDEIKNYLAQA
jgi:hypothetical protein